MVEPGATLKNVIIGKDQMEGVHCEQSGCTIQNVWWEDVCEDALSIKGGSASSVTKVIGGGARSADDKVIQHNGLGTVSIEGFYAQDFGKLYRSCGTCGGKSRDGEQELGRPGHAPEHQDQGQEAGRVPVVAGLHFGRAQEAGRRSLGLALPVLHQHRLLCISERVLPNWVTPASISTQIKSDADV
ncbi:hypothetical protein PI124_g23586 [Phytophthora idaei]|nr:hypothetical protein PI124_g23586 [Phytophthora idaei]